MRLSLLVFGLITIFVSSVPAQASFWDIITLCATCRERDRQWEAEKERVAQAERDGEAKVLREKIAGLKQSLAQNKSALADIKYLAQGLEQLQSQTQKVASQAALELSKRTWLANTFLPAITRFWKSDARADQETLTLLDSLLTKLEGTAGGEKFAKAQLIVKNLNELAESRNQSLGGLVSEAVRQLGDEDAKSTVLILNQINSKVAEMKAYAAARQKFYEGEIFSVIHDLRAQNETLAPEDAKVWQEKHRWN